MGNSAIKLQEVIDYASTIGKLSPVINAAGFYVMHARKIADEVMTEMLAQRFNWKWNRIIVPPFLTNSWQADYPGRTVQGIGWLEHAAIVDINNTSLPKPILWLEGVRDLERTSYQLGQPAKICWLPNDQLVEHPWAEWPGAAKTYTDPLTATQAPANGYTAILDAHSNILVLTTYGVTGNTAPDAGAAPAAGTTVNDGTCVWTVVDPKMQGFRLSPLPPQTGRTWQVHVIAQAKPPRFTSLDQTLDPIPDDYAKWFQQGYEAQLYGRAGDPRVSAEYEQKHAAWLGALQAEKGQGDREKEDGAIVPDHNIMAGGEALPLGPAWPFGPGGVR